MSEQEKDTLEGKWYVIHTYSGYEHTVTDKIEKIIENRQDEDVFDVRVPMEKYTEVRNNERVIKERKILPGYVRETRSKSFLDLLRVFPQKSKKFNRTSRRSKPSSICLGVRRP